MPKTSFTHRRVRPIAFDEYCQTRSERTVQLTQQAIAALQARGQPVTLVALAEATRPFDEEGKGLAPNTILRNPRAAELFRERSAAYQVRLSKTRDAKRKRPKPGAITRATYHGLRASDLILIVEDLKAQIVELKAEQVRLKTQRDEACRLRDQALQQNTRQLAMLTQSTIQSVPIGDVQ